MSGIDYLSITDDIDISGDLISLEVSPAEQLFCELLISGKTGTDAYRIAYDAWEMKRDSIRDRSASIRALPRIRKHIEYLQQRLASKCLWTREQSVLALIGIVQGPNKPNDVLMAVRELNIMHGYIPSKLLPGQSDTVGSSEPNSAVQFYLPFNGRELIEGSSTRVSENEPSNN